MGSDLLYLDTVRLGRMSPGAQQAHGDFARLAGAEGGSLFFERFLRSGVDTCAAQVASRYPGLATWWGVGGLQRALRVLAGSPPDLPVLLANRSAQLMKLAARLLFHPCRNVLVTDLGWPGYHAILLAEARRANRRVTTVPVREAILGGRITEDELITRIRAEFLGSGCDGLFLTAVSHLGLRLPVERVVRAVEAAGKVCLVAVDGAQDFCHLSANLGRDYCDFYLAGCHKWLGAYHPLGLGFYGRRRSRSFIETVLARLMESGELDDPLLRFSTQLETNALDATTETVSLAALFSCQGAVGDAMAGAGRPVDALACRLRNQAVAAELAAASGWRLLLPQPAFRTGILLLEAERSERRAESAEEIRSAFYGFGAALTAYESGLIRLSMPGVGWQPGEVEHLQDALRAIA